VVDELLDASEHELGELAGERVGER